METVKPGVVFYIKGLKEGIMMYNEETKNATERRYIEWLVGLEASLEQLQYADSVSKQIQHAVQDLSFQGEISSLRNKILMQKNVISSLVSEVMTAQSNYSVVPDKTEITMGRLIADSHLREKVLKAEQAVFMLRYQVNQLLSKAS